MGVFDLWDYFTMSRFHGDLLALLSLAGNKPTVHETAVISVVKETVT